jgi:hypothetical protein
MNKQFEDLLELYKKYIDIFNNWTNDRETLKDYERLVNIYLWLTDILLDNNIIEKHGIKKYKVVESGEII